MKFTINAKQLATALAAVVIVATKGLKRDYDDAKKITLHMDGGELTAVANGGHVAISTKLRVSPPTAQGSITLLDADLLAKTLAAFPPSSQLVCEARTPEPAKPKVLQFVIRDVGSGVAHTLLGDPTPIAMPTPISEAAGTFQISRSDFIDAARVAKAVGDEKFKPEFLHWVFRVQPGGYRAVAGCGARFFIHEKQGSGVVQCHTPYNLLILGEQTPTLVRILGALPAEQLSFRDLGNTTEGLTEIVADHTIIYLIAQDSTTKWPDEMKFLNRPNPYRFVCRLSDWATAMKGVRATYDAETRRTNQLHYAKLTFDPTQRSVRVEASGSQSVTFEQVLSICDLQAPGLAPPLVFQGLSMYMTEIPGFAGRKGYMQLELIDDKKPIVIRFSSVPFVQDDCWERDETTMTKQRKTTFFANISKKAK